MDPITREPLGSNYQFEANDQAKNEANFNNAVATRDPNQFLQIAQQAGVDTPVGQAAIATASELQNRRNQFASTVEPINKAGGPGTPQGNIAIAKVFESTSDQPLYGKALIAYITGNKEQAFNLWTGGVPKTSIEHANDNGNVLEIKTNWLGERISYFDTQTGQYLTKDEYSRRGGSLSALANTFAGKTLEENRALYNDAYNKEKEGFNAYIQTYANLPTRLNFINNFFGDPATKTDLPPEDYAKSLSITGRNMGLANNTSKSQSDFDQIVKDAGTTNGVKVTNEINAKLGTNFPIGKIINVEGGAGGSKLVTQDGSFSESINNLRSRQSTDSKSAENTKNTTETFDSIVKSNRFQHALKGKSDKDKALFIQRYETALRFSNEIGNELASLANKYPKPAFISLPTSASFTDPQALVMTQMAQHAHNAKQLESFGKFLDANVKMYSRTNTLPVPGAIGAAYVKRPEFKEINARSASTIDGILVNEYVARDAANAANVAKAAKAVTAAPPAALPVAGTPAVPQAVVPPGNLGTRNIEAVNFPPLPNPAQPAAQVAAPAAAPVQAAAPAPVQAAAPAQASVPPPAPVAAPAPAPLPAAAPAPAPAPAAAATAKKPAPKVGDVVTHEGKKYRYKGGDPNKQSNWTEVK
jgi:hypothetical protein